MKKSLFARVGAAFIAFPLIVLFQAPTGSASDGGESGGASLSETSCSDTGVFPTSIYTQLNTGSDGSMSGFEIRASFSDGNCSLVLYSSNAVDDGTSAMAQKSRKDSVIILR